jgi:hypothetical protein
MTTTLALDPKRRFGIVAQCSSMAPTIISAVL